MRAAHTPGPWNFSASFDSVERRVKHGDNPPLVWAIASGINSAHPDYMPRAEQIANARLIAAAPELLDALDRISTAYDETLRHPIASQLLQAIYRSRAAIAKAKGGDK